MGVDMADERCDSSYMADVAKSLCSFHSKPSALASHATACARLNADYGCSLCSFSLQPLLQHRLITPTTWITACAHLSER